MVNNEHKRENYGYELNIVVQAVHSFTMNELALKGNDDAIKMFYFYYFIAI